MNQKQFKMKEEKILTTGKDPRVFREILDRRLTDKSFQEKGFFGITPKYAQHEVREIWFRAMAIGMEEGLRMGTVQGQRIDLFNNCKYPRQREFLEKFYELANAYNCAITYHPHHGMMVQDLNTRNSINQEFKDNK